MNYVSLLVTFGLCVAMFLTANEAWPAESGTIAGLVTGETDFLPWRGGKETLGWAMVRLYQDGNLRDITHTNFNDGDFAIELSPGVYTVEVSRPAFLSQSKEVHLAAGARVEVDFHLTQDPDYPMIITPRTGMAISRLDGETFTVECDASQEAAEWQAELFTQYFTRSLQILSTVYTANQPWQKTGWWTLTMMIPEDTEPEMYGLRIRCTQDDRRRVAHQAKVVRVLSEYPADFDIMLHRDFHLNWPLALEAKGTEHHATYFATASLISPLFVSLGDDIGFEGDDHYASFHYYVSRYLDVPVYMAYGNHDVILSIPGMEFYLGPGWQGRDIGPHLHLTISRDFFAAKDVFTRGFNDYSGWGLSPQDWRTFEVSAQQAQWVEADLQQAHAAPQNKLIFLVGHRNDWPARAYDYFDLPFSEQQRTFFPEISVSPLTREFDKLFMDVDVVNTAHGYAGLNYTTGLVRIDNWSSAEVFAPIYLPAVEYEPANNGTSATVTAHIRLLGDPNPDPFDAGGGFAEPPEDPTQAILPNLRQAQLKFVMPHGRYQTSAGIISQQIDSDNGALTIVYVTVNVPSPQLSVTVSPEE